MYTYIHLSLSLYIYLYIERERCIYIYIYMHVFHTSVYISIYPYSRRDIQINKSKCSTEQSSDLSSSGSRANNTCVFTVPQRGIR